MDAGPPVPVGPVRAGRAGLSGKAESAGVSRLRLNRSAAGSYSWSVAVEAAGGSTEQLKRAKETALALCRQLEAELGEPDAQLEDLGPSAERPEVER